MRGHWTLFLGMLLAMTIAGCSDNAAKRPVPPAEKPNLGEPGNPPESLPESDKQSADAAKPAEKTDAPAAPVVSADKVLETAKEAVATKSAAKSSQIDDTIDDVDEEE